MHANVRKNQIVNQILSHRINEMSHLNASVSFSWWNVECVGLANIDFDSMRWWTGNGVCVLALGVLVGDEVTELWLTALSEFSDVAGVGGEAAIDSEHPCDFFVFEFGVDLVDGFPVLELSLAFECSSSRSLQPLSSFNASAASNDLRCMPIEIIQMIITEIIRIKLVFRIVKSNIKMQNNNLANSINKIQ